MRVPTQQFKLQQGSEEDTHRTLAGHGPDEILVNGVVEIGIDVFPGPPNTLAISREIGIDAPNTLALSRGIETIMESPSSQNKSPFYQDKTGSPQCATQRIIKKKKRRAPFLSYEVATWIVHVILVVLACVDRFTWNVWPRQKTFKIGGGGAGGGGDLHAVVAGGGGGPARYGCQAVDSAPLCGLGTGRV